MFTKCSSEVCCRSYACIFPALPRDELPTLSLSVAHVAHGSTCFHIPNSVGQFSFQIVSISPFSIAKRDDDFMILKFDDLFTLNFAKFRGQKNRLPKFHCTLRSRLTRSHRLSHNLSTDPGFADSFISFVFCQWLSCYPQVGKIYKDVFFNAWWEKIGLWWITDETPGVSQQPANAGHAGSHCQHVLGPRCYRFVSHASHARMYSHMTFIWLSYDFVWLWFIWLNSQLLKIFLMACSRTGMDGLILNPLPTVIVQPQGDGGESSETWPRWDTVHENLKFPFATKLCSSHLNIFKCVYAFSTWS